MNTDAWLVVLAILGAVVAGTGIGFGVYFGVRFIADRFVERKWSALIAVAATAIVAVASVGGLLVSLVVGVVLLWRDLRRLPPKEAKRPSAKDTNGAPVRYCPSCGIEVGSPDARFCIRCGADLTS